MNTDMEDRDLDLEWEEEDQPFLEAQFLVNHILDRNPSDLITRLTTDFDRLQSESTIIIKRLEKNTLERYILFAYFVKCCGEKPRTWHAVVQDKKISSLHYSLKDMSSQFQTSGISLLAIQKKLVNKSLRKNPFLYLTSSIWEVIDEKLKKIPSEQLWESLLSGEDNSILSEIKIALMRDLINEVEAEFGKKTGVPIRVLKEHNKKLKALKRQVDEGKGDPEDYETLLEKLTELRIKWIKINSTGGTDSEDMPTEIEVSNEMAEYVISNPEEKAEYSEKQLQSRNRLKHVIVEYIDSLSPQAEPQKGVGRFLLPTIDSGEIDKYIRETRTEDPKLGRFRLDSKKISEDLGIPQRTVERFCKGLYKFFSGKYSFSSTL